MHLVSHRERSLLKLLKYLQIVMGVLAVGTVGFLRWLRLVPPFSLPRSERLGPVRHVRAAGGCGHVVVSWEPLPEAVSYRVLRRDRPRGEFRLAGSFGVAPRIVLNVLRRFIPGEPFGRFPRPPFVDTAVTPGRSYSYQVIANDGSAWSSPGEIAEVSVPVATPSSINIRVEAASEKGKLPHKWEYAIGSEHLSYLLTTDASPEVRNAGAALRFANKLAHDELGMTYVRAHGIFLDDMNVYREDAAGNPSYDWTAVDQIYDMVHADGLKPIVELGFMPRPLASGTGRRHEVFFYRGNTSPPKDYAKWSALVTALATHLIQRYGLDEVESWPFEVWNEPDLSDYPMVRFWSGSQEEYFKLYEITAMAVKGADPRLRVGGPVAAFCRIQEAFLHHLAARRAEGVRIPFDFFDFHQYNGLPGDWRPVLRRYGFEGTKIYVTEWGVSGLFGDATNDKPYGAAWIIRGLHDSLDLYDGITYWTASDYFEEDGPPKRFFHGGFGLIGLDGLRKSRYWAYYLLHRLGTCRVLLQGEGDGFGALVTGWATRTPDNNHDRGLRILLSSVTELQQQADGMAILDRNLLLTIAGLIPRKDYQVRIARIDNEHSNVYGEWQRMGRPRWPNAAQLAELHHHDGLSWNDPPSSIVADTSGQLQIECDLPMPGVLYVELS